MLLESSNDISDGLFHLDQLILLTWRMNTVRMKERKNKEGNERRI